MLTKFLLILYICAGGQCQFIHSKTPVDSLEICQEQLRAIAAQRPSEVEIDGTCIKLQLPKAWNV